MGQSQSKKEWKPDNAELVKQMAAIMQNSSDDKWVPEALSGVIVINRRPDGSSIKELYIPEWNVAFFQSGYTISVRKQDTALEGKPVHLIVAHAILLHNLLIKSSDYLTASNIAKDAFRTYLDVNDVKN